MFLRPYPIRIPKHSIDIPPKWIPTNKHCIKSDHWSCVVFILSIFDMCSCKRMMMEMIKEGMDQSIWPNFIQYSMKSKRRFSAKDKKASVDDKRMCMMRFCFTNVLFWQPCLQHNQWYAACHSPGVIQSSATWTVIHIHIPPLCPLIKIIHWVLVHEVLRIHQSHIA